MDSPAAALRTVDHLSALVAYWDRDERCVFANAAYRERLGVGPAEMIGMTMKEFIGPMYDFTRPYIQGALAGKRQSFERQIRRAGGGFMEALVTFTPDVENGVVVGFTAHVSDVTELRSRESALAGALEQLQRLSMIYEALRNCGAAITHCGTEEELFQEVCRVAVVYGGMKMAWVGIVDEAFGGIRPVASFGDEFGYLRELVIVARGLGPSANGPTARAIRDRRPYWCQNFLHDPITMPWHGAAARAGWGSSASLPLYRGGLAIGALGLYAAVPNAFDEDIQRLLTSMAAEISLALDAFANEAALAASEARYRALVELTPEPNLVIRDGGVIYANPAAVEAFAARSPDELVGRRVLDFVHPDSRELAISRLKLLAEGAPGNPRIGYRFVTLRGDTIDVEVQSTVIEFDGAPAVHVIMRDVTARRKAERDARASRALLDAIIDSSPSHIFALDLQQQFTLANHALAAFHGMSKDELVGKTLQDVFPPDLAASLHAINSRVIDTGIPDSREEMIESRSGESPRVLITSKFPLRDERGAITGIAGVATDVTAHRITEAERTSLAAQLEQSQKMESVGRLAGGVAHDFNNMLGVILGHAEMAMNRIDPSDASRADFEEIKHAAERSTELTRQLLTFARQQVVAPQVVDLNDAVERTMRMLQRLIGEDIAIDWRPGDALWPVLVDPSQLHQILINLFVNARDAIDDVGTIELSTANDVIDEGHGAALTGAMPGEYVRLTVRDDGRGMDRQTMALIFEPFFTTKPQGEGTGLGLSTVYGAVKQNHGTITVASTPGAGTTFDIYLPRHDGPRTRAEPASAPATVAHGTETILLVEDEPAMLNLSTLALEAHGYTVIGAASAGEAIRIAELRPREIHLLLTDVIMPEMNGRDLAEHLLVMHPGMRHLYMSGYPADVIGRHGMLGEGVHLIQKPFSVFELAAKVRGVLDAR